MRKEKSSCWSLQETERERGYDFILWGGMVGNWGRKEK